MKDPIKLLTECCLMCGQRSVVTVERHELSAWQAGELIQKAFPSLSAGVRELLMTGTHPACWEEMFAEE